MGLFDMFKKKNKEEAAAVPQKNPLTFAAEVYNADNNDTNFLTVLAILKKTETWVPLMETEYGAMPYILESEDGTQFYPVFSEESQIHTEYAESLSWATLPFESSARYIMESTEVSNMLLNAFTKSVVIPEESIRVMMNENTSEYAADGGSLELFPASDDAEAQNIQAKAAAFFKERTDVKKAYFAKLKNGVEMSYIFVADVDGDAQSMFKELFDAIGQADISMPIDYTVYPTLKEQLEKIECEPFFAV
ncbi:MAG: enhanced serine sensitivity protein SseB C-terminal domain-containing protein [Oscillospiraceae bacterium]|nr:enhanced serine sensitivity protein SseB C-terminal domain-containing protein [Oscillospiraceae bacterium]